MSPLMVINTIRIHAPIEKVWDALVNPEQTKKYMFGCETVSNWQPGSSLLWKMDYEGKDLIAVKGKIVTYEPPVLLAYTTIDPNAKDMADIPENYLTVTYSLERIDDEVVLTVSQGDYAMVADGAGRYEEASNGGEGWNPILVQIKNLVEA